MYKGYISHLVVAQPLVMPYIGYVCVLLHLKILHRRYAHLCLNIGVSLKGRTTHIWSFGCNFAYTTKKIYAGFKLSFGISTILQLLTIIKKDQVLKIFQAFCMVSQAATLCL